MRYYVYIVLLFLSWPDQLAAQTSVPIYDFEEFKPYLQKDNDTLYVINFWATWCKPCIEEMPYFEKLRSDTFRHPHKIILVSLDFKNQIDTKLIPFLEEHEIINEVVALCDPDANAWIDKVDSLWSGAIPATIIYHRDKKRFYGEQFSDYDQLREMVLAF